MIELCGAARLGHFGRSQFYVALKLVAAAQVGLPLTSDTFKSKSTVIPLPQFYTLPLSSNELPTNQKMPLRHQLSGDQVSKTPGQLPPPPTASKPRTKVRQNTNGSQPVHSDMSPVHIQTARSKQSDYHRRDSRGSLSDADSPIPNAKSETNWTLFREEKAAREEDGQKWINLEERRLLLEREHDDSSDGPDEAPIDIWDFSEEQRDYYVKQFLQVQPDLRGVVSGSVAKVFFEKSKLPSHELSNIWKLSDANKDGALDLNEFCIAMHLVVLRRNKIDLPKELPRSLKARVISSSDMPATSRKSLPSEDLGEKRRQMVGRPRNQSEKGLLSPHSSQWTKFSDSPTSNLLAGVTVTSPPESAGMKPANFDFNAASIERDPRILHPIALRMSPDGHSLVNSSENLSTFQSNVYATGSKILHGPPAIMAKKLDPPPPPPPRPRRTHNHARSSSLDLNRMGKNYLEGPHHPPSHGQRLSPLSSHGLGPNSGHGAFSIYRKPPCYRPGAGACVVDNGGGDPSRSGFGFPPDVPDPKYVVSISCVYLFLINAIFIAIQVIPSNFTALCNRCVNVEFYWRT